MLAMQNPLDRLRISGPLPSEQEAAETRKALQEGHDMLAREGVSAPTLKAVIWRLMQDAAATEAKLPDRERAWLLSAGRSIWPELARPSEDNRKVEWEITMEELAGVRSRNFNAPVPRFSLSDPAAVSRWLVVQGWLRYVRARTSATLRRDKEIFLARAKGMSTREIGRAMRGRIGDRAIEMVREKVIRHIEEGLSAAKLLDTSFVCSKIDTG